MEIISFSYLVIEIRKRIIKIEDKISNPDFIDIYKKEFIDRLNKYFGINALSNQIHSNEGFTGVYDDGKNIIIQERNYNKYYLTLYNYKDNKKYYRLSEVQIFNKSDIGRYKLLYLAD